MAKEHHNELNKQLFGYGDYDLEGKLQFRGYSRKFDLQRLNQLHKGRPATEVVRIPQTDMINTELGFIERSLYLAAKGLTK